MGFNGDLIDLPILILPLWPYFVVDTYGLMEVQWGLMRFNGMQ